jgi:transcriptional regulator with XRE-family HTH domain
MKNILTTLRKSAKISQDTLAKRLGISRPTLIAIEKGERELKVSELCKLAEIFEASPESILKGEIPAKNQSDDMLVTIPQKNLTKFKEVLLYILEKIGAKPNVGQTVLYKLLYFIDFDYFEEYQEQLIGATYIKNHYGPTPIEFAKIVEEMKRTDQIEEVKSKFFSFDMKKYIPRKHADLSKFSAQERQTIDEVLRKYSNKTASELSKLSHKDVPWAASEMGEEIDYQLAFYREEPFSVGIYDEL